MNEEDKPQHTHYQGSEMSIFNNKLDNLLSLVTDLKNSVQGISNQQHLLEIWRGQIDLRLQNGTEEMKEQKERTSEIKAELLEKIKVLDDEIKTLPSKYIERRLVAAYIAGATAVGGGAAAGIMKALGVF